MKEQQKDYNFLSDIVASEKDLDIRAYTRKIKEELSRLEDDCITDFLTINQQVGVLYSEFNQTEQILTKIENIVDHFQDDLTGIASQVSILQEKSQTYNTQLRNRKQLESIINNHVQSIFLSEELIQSLCNDDIDNEYLEKVAHLNQILINSKNQELGDTKSFNEIKADLEKLKLKVCSRARSFLMVKMNNLRKPKTNFQILQESILLKYKPLLAFLRDHSQETFVELTNYYSEVMNKIYYHLIKTYIKETKKLIGDRISKSDMIIIEDIKPSQQNKAITQAFEFINTLSNQRVHTESNQLQPLAQLDPFVIEDRLSILQKEDSTPVVTTISLTKNQRFYPEEIFRSQNKIIIEAVSKEFVFILEFFDLKLAQCSYIFNQIFSKIVNYYLEWVTSFIQDKLHDQYAIIMMSIINDQNKRLLHQNKIMVLDFYFDKLNMIIWPRFTQLTDVMANNIKHAVIKNFKLYNQTVVHQSTIKFAQHLRSMSQLRHHVQQDMVAIRINQLKVAFIEFLHLISKGHFTDEKDQRSFLINNLDFIINHLKEGGDLQPAEIELFMKHIQELLNQTTNNLFKEHFESLENIIATHCNSVDDSSEEVASNFKNLQQLNAKHLEDVSQEFQMNYKHKIDSITKHLKHSIQNINTQHQMLTRFLRSLMLKYSSMIELIKKTNPQCLKQMTPPHLILLDLKNIQNTTIGQ